MGSEKGQIAESPQEYTARVWQQQCEASALEGVEDATPTFRCRQSEVVGEMACVCLERKREEKSRKTRID